MGERARPNTCHITKEFRLTVQQIKTSMRLELKELIPQMERAAVGLLQRYSPVDTGFMRNNWSVKITNMKISASESVKSAGRYIKESTKRELGGTHSIVTFSYTISNPSRAAIHQWHGWNAVGYQLLDVKIKPNGKLQVLRASRPIAKLERSSKTDFGSERRKDIEPLQSRSPLTGKEFTILTKPKRMPPSEKLRGKKGGRSVVKRIHARWKDIVNQSKWWRMDTTKNLTTSFKFGNVRESADLHNAQFKE